MTARLTARPFGPLLPSKLLLGLATTALTVFLHPSAGVAATERLQLWHNMIYSHRDVLAELTRRFENENPEIRVDVIYRETEELRSSYQSAVMGGSGPDLIYGPSDQVGPMATMGIIAPLDGLLPNELTDAIDPLALVRFRNHLYMVGDKVGNYLMLIYNKQLIPKAPTTTDELITIGKQQTVDLNGDGKPDRYGLVFNFTEPFFFVPWIKGFGESFFTPDGAPNLKTPATVAAFQFIKDLRDRDHIIPAECDYEMANALFKQGRAAMIVNGDWSWGDYKKAGIDFGVARLPMVSATGRWPAPLVGTTGYSLNPNLSVERRALALRLLAFLNSEDSQLAFVKAVGSLPSRLSLRTHSAVSENPWLKESSQLMAVSEPMPIVPEVRAVWDSLRGEYQSVLGGGLSPEKAAGQAQDKSLKQIELMNERLKADSSIYLMWLVFLGLALWLLAKSWHGLRDAFVAPAGSIRFPLALAAPGIIGILLVVLYPFGFNLVLSFSNFSLNTFRDWSLIGFHHYFDVLTDSLFYIVLAKTLLWTFINVFLHVVIGVTLALIINQTLPAKPLFRTLLIIPWAVPQYITALTWRSLFNREYGPINQFLTHFLHLPALDWLSDPLLAFSACLLTNIWLGFPFMMVIALGGLQAIPQELHEAARVDGASSWARFRIITLPLLMPVIKPAAVLGCIWTFNSLGVIWLVSNGGEPADKTHILVSYIYKSAFNLYRYGSASALSMITFLILLGLGFVLMRKETEVVR